MNYKTVSFPSQDLISKAEPNMYVYALVCAAANFQSLSLVFFFFLFLLMHSILQNDSADIVRR